jgi:hypothetical protein
MFALIVLCLYDLYFDSVSVPGWTYLALILITFCWNVLNTLAESVN